MNAVTQTVAAEPVSGVEIFVPLAKLKKSPRNARKVSHGEAAIEALAASIQHKGLIQNLVVEPEIKEDGTPTGYYLVTAGEGRRLAMLLRAKRKQIKKSEPVRCWLDTANDPSEISLDENVTRTNMHPADEFERFRELATRRLGGGAEESRSDEEAFRQQEFELLRRSQKNPMIELVTDWIGGEQYGPLSPWIEGVGLVHRLRETRVLAGFSRLKPRSEGGPGIQPLSLPGSGVRWLPAIDVFGEGIFISFRLDRLEEWSRRPEVGQRISAPLKAYDRVRVARGEVPSKAHARQIFLHTFAHAFMKELSFACGYGSSSLRERLYVDVERPDQPMSGVLIYTAAGDADGTLGGLVAQGRPDRLPTIIIEALRRSTWCSNDPVCLEGAGSGADTGSRAACHSCTLVAETSCENGNRLLDRALLVGTPSEPGIGFLEPLSPGSLNRVLPV